MKVSTIKEVVKVCNKQSQSKKVKISLHMSNCVKFEEGKVVATDGKCIIIKSIDTEGINGLVDAKYLRKAKTIVVNDKDSVLIDGIEINYVTDVMYPQYMQVIPEVDNNYKKFRIAEKATAYYIDWDNNKLIPFDYKAYIADEKMTNKDCPLYFIADKMPKYVKCLMIKNSGSAMKFTSDKVIYVKMPCKTRRI